MALYSMPTPPLSPATLGRPASSTALGTDALPGPDAVKVERLDAFFGTTQILKSITLNIAPRQVAAIIGPSGCGKSTFLRCLNRMHEVTPGARASGMVAVHGQDIYARGVDPVALRRRIGMVFQRPNPFPTLSIAGNVTAGLALNGVTDRAQLAETTEVALKQAALWDEVKDRLKSSPLTLSGGQQQRLCIARAIAMGPGVLLMDEPASALDPIATARIEELIHELRERYTIVIVTHNLQQAARVSDTTAFFLLGELVEHGATEGMFTRPKDRRTEDYVTGKFG